MDRTFIQEAEPSAVGWEWTLLYSAVLITAGAITLIWPFASAVAIGTFVGWALCVAGVFGIVAGVRALRARGHWLNMAAGGLSLILGLLILPLPLAGSLTLLWTLSLWFAVSGVLEIGAGWTCKEDRLPLLLLGVLDLFLALLLMFGFTAGDLWLVPLLAGTSFIATGLVTAVGAISLDA